MKNKTSDLKYIIQKLKYHGIYRFSKFPKWNVLITEFEYASDNDTGWADTISGIAFDIIRNKFDVAVKLSVLGLGKIKFLGMLEEDAELMLYPTKFNCGVKDDE